MGHRAWRMGIGDRASAVLERVTGKARGALPEEADQELRLGFSPSLGALGLACSSEPSLAF